MTSEPAHGFSRRALAWIVAFTAASFALGIVLTAFAEDIGETRSAGSDVFSFSAIGHRATVELLRRSGVPVHIRRTGRPGPLGPATPLVIAEPPSSAPADGEPSSQVNRFLEEALAMRAPVLVILPKWMGMPDKSQPRWVDRVQPHPVSVLRGVIEELGPCADSTLRPLETTTDLDESCETTWGRPIRVAVRGARFLAPSPGFETLVSCGGRPLLVRVKRRSDDQDLYVLSDPDVLNNQGLGKGENARLVLDLFTKVLHGQSVVWDETAHGFEREGGLLRELFGFPLVLALAQGVLLAGWVLWSGVGRFGKPQSPKPPVEGGKQVLIDNIAQLLSTSGNAALLLSRYLDQTMRAVGSHYFLPANLTQAELLSRFQGISAAQGSDLDIQDTVSAIHALIVTPHPPVHVVLAQAVRLHIWREAMTHVD